MVTIEQAFERIHREDFLPTNLKYIADIDAPIPIGYGQTNSQPSTVKKMLEWLDAKPENKVMDVGSGSGWTSALLSDIVGSKGTVWAVEIIPELLNMSEENCKAIGKKNIFFFQAGEHLGLPEFAPFDRILVSAAAKSLPLKLLKQLKIGGKMIIPIKNDILEVSRILEKEYITTVHPGFTFVPLIY
jgi:protein-L-isoaspartate(D-aspartate) O-methyltransferase